MYYNKIKVELNKEQIDMLASLARKELEKQPHYKEIGKRMFRKYSKILFALTGKNY